MNYHDYHLRGYSVTDFGKTIVLDLVWNYPNQPLRESRIEFNGVELYHFVHTGGAIITDITTDSLESILSDVGARLPEWDRQLGVSNWRGTFDEYRRFLEEKGLAGWRIESAVGFAGFIFGKEARQLSDRTSS